MKIQKYRIGDRVLFAGRFDSRMARGEYVVVRVLPDEAGLVQYRLRSQVGSPERVAREYELSRSPVQ